MPLIGVSSTWNTFGNTHTASAVVPIISSLTTAQDVRGRSNLRAITDVSPTPAATASS
jgi:hypothetical protein